MAEQLRPGTRVEVRNRFDRAWVAGFEVAEQVEDGYRVRRLTDGAELPRLFGPDEVRKARRNDMWWF